MRATNQPYLSRAVNEDILKENDVKCINKKSLTNEMREHFCT